MNKTTIGNITHECDCGNAKIELIPTSEDVFDLNAVNCKDNSNDKLSKIAFGCWNCEHSFIEVDSYMISEESKLSLKDNKVKTVIKVMPKGTLDIAVNFDFKVDKLDEFTNEHKAIKVAENETHDFYVKNRVVNIEHGALVFDIDPKNTKEKLGKLLEEQVGICGHTISTFSKMIELPSQRVSNWVRDGMSETLFFICMNRLGVKVNMTGIN